MSRPRPRKTSLYIRKRIRFALYRPGNASVLIVAGVAIFLPLQAHASPFDTGFNNLQTLCKGTIAKFASNIAIVLGGIGFATGEPGAKKNLAGVAIALGLRRWL